MNNETIRNAKDIMETNAGQQLICRSIMICIRVHVYGAAPQCVSRFLGSF